MTTNIIDQLTETDTSNQEPLTTIREGAVAASIWHRKSAAGLEYLEFSLSRSWKSKNGDKEGYSKNFFENNEGAIIEVVTRACQFIRSCQSKQSVTDPSAGPIGDKE